MALNLVEGWTDDIPYDLKKTNSSGTSAFDLTGSTVAITMRDAAGNILSPTGTLTVTSAAAGSVSYAPGVGELLASLSPISVRFKVTRSGGKISYFPSRSPEKWVIKK